VPIFPTRNFLGEELVNFVKRLVASVASIAVAAAGLVAVAPAASAELSSGCQKVDTDGSYTGSSIMWQGINGYSFSAGETLKITFSSPGITPTTAHISLGTSAAPGVPASWSSKASTTTFPATLTYTLDQDYTFLMFNIDDGNVVMDYECGIAQTITFANPGDQEYNTGSITLSATSDSGLDVSFSASGSCSVSGTTLNFSNFGTCTVTASQSGGSDYLAATDVERSFDIVTAASLTDNSNGTMTTSGVSSKEHVYFCPTSVSAASCFVGAGATYTSESTGLNQVWSEGSSVRDGSTFVTGESLPAGTYNVAVWTQDPTLSTSLSNVVIGSSSPGGGGGGGGGGVSASPSVSTPASTPVSTATTSEVIQEILKFIPNADKNGLIASGNGIEVVAQIVTTEGNSKILSTDDELLSEDPAESLEIEFDGDLKEDSTLTATLSGGTEECSVTKSGVVAQREDRSPIGLSYRETIRENCEGPWTLVVSGTLSNGTPFTLEAPVVLSPKRSEPVELKAKDSYFFQGKSDAFTEKAPRKLRSAISEIPENSSVSIEVIGVSTSLKGKKKNRSLAKKRCEAIEGFIAGERPDLDIAFEPSAIGAKKKGGKLPGKEGLVRNKKGKPLTTVRWELVTS
jgi:hypothetical protein